jgi:hypothetical protein
MVASALHQRLWPIASQHHARILAFQVSRKVGSSWVTIAISCSTRASLGGFPLNYSTSVTFLDVAGHVSGWEVANNMDTHKICPPKSEKKNSLHFAAKLFLDIKCQDMRKQDLVKTTNQHIKTNLHWVLTHLYEGEEKGSCYYMLTAQPSSFPTFLPFCKNL